jgi:hypothetical protein
MFKSEFRSNRAKLYPNIVHAFGRTEQRNRNITLERRSCIKKASKDNFNPNSLPSRIRAHCTKQPCTKDTQTIPLIVLTQYSAVQRNRLAELHQLGRVIT